MSTPFTLDDTMSDFNPPSKVAADRMLLLSPPGLSSHPAALEAICAKYDRNITDIQMLDRLAAGQVTLPESTYRTIMILNDVDGTRTQSSKLLGRDTFQKIVQALQVGGTLTTQDGTAGKHMADDEHREAVLAGLIPNDAGGMTKPEPAATVSIPLRLRKKDTAATVAPGASESNAVQPPLSNGEHNNGINTAKVPEGVGFVDSDDDLEDPGYTTDELIDEDTLLDEGDLARPILQPAACRPKPGKRRRACKDCTCGLKEKYEKEDAYKRANADKALSTMKLEADDLAEVDFTVQGKVGSCGNCALGDAFRCDGCPYIGLPAFKPGEEVRLLNDEPQL